jgi:hypothetical protein
MALLPAIPEVISKQSEWLDWLISAIGGYFPACTTLVTMKTNL